MSASKKQRATKQQRVAEYYDGGSAWSSFTRRFRSLAKALAEPKPLTVYQEFKSGEPNSDEWIFSPHFLVKDRFEEVAVQAGKCLGSSDELDPLCFWLDHLHAYLSRHAGGRGLRTRELGAGGVQRVIDDVIKSSEEFSRWLSESPRNAIKLLTEIPAESPSSKRSPSPAQHANELSANIGGEAWAAKQNQQREARSDIVDALRAMVEPHDRWPDFVQAWEANARYEPHYSHQVFAPQFQPPAYERLGQQSIEQWKSRADAAWRQHRNRFVAQQQEAEKRGIDEKIPPPRRTRGPGRANRNANIDERYKWAGRRLLGSEWKEIANGEDVSTVRKAASQVLRSAGWPIKLSAIKQATSFPKGPRAAR